MNGVFLLTIEIQHVGLAGDIFQIRDEDFAARDSGLLQDFRFFRDEFRPGGAGRIKQEQVVVGSLVIGLNQKLAADIFDDIVRIIGDLRNDGTERFLGFGEVAIIDAIAALAFSPVGDAEDCESFVLRGADVVKALGIGLVLKDEFILGLGSANAVEVHGVENVFGREFVGRIRRGIAAIEEAIARPADVGGFDPFQSVGENFAGSDFHDVDFLPIGTSSRNAVGDVTAVLGNIENAEARSAVFGKLVGIEKHFGGGVEAALDVEDVLVLQAIVFEKEVGVAAAEGRRIFGIVEKFFEAMLDLSAVGNLIEIGKRNFILGFDPGEGFGGVVVLEPAVGICDLGAVIVVDLIGFAGDGIVEGLPGGRNRGNADVCGDDQDRENTRAQ